MAAPDARRHDGPIAHPEHAMAFAIPHPARLLAGGLLLACGSAHAAVFVNELHYANAGGDSGERLENVDTDGESRSEEPTSELQSLMRNSHAVICFTTTKQKKSTS